MQKKNAFFVIGSPGSGKDVVIRDIISNYNIQEFTSEQIESMLSLEENFNKSKYEKRKALLNRDSIIVNCKSYDLNFITSKYILESVDYTTHLILVEANIKTAFSRIKNRDLKESLERISQGNANKETILESFNKKIIVKNSENLCLTECREFVSEKLSDLVFKSTLTADKFFKNRFKDKIKGKGIPPQSVASETGLYNLVLPTTENLELTLPTEFNSNSEPLSKKEVSSNLSSKRLKRIQHSLGIQIPKSI